MINRQGLDPLGSREPAERGSPSRPNRSISPLNPKKIQNLQNEFQSLKQKIKEVEIRNSQMLSKIKGKIGKNHGDEQVVQ